MKSAGSGGIWSLANGVLAGEEGASASPPAQSPVPPAPSSAQHALLDDLQQQNQQQQQQPQHHHPNLSFSSGLDEFGFVSGSEGNSPRFASEEEGGGGGGGAGAGQQAAFSTAAALAASAFPGNAAAAAAEGTSPSAAAPFLSPGGTETTSFTPSPSSAPSAAAAALQHFEEHREPSPTPAREQRPRPPPLPPSLLRALHRAASSPLPLASPSPPSDSPRSPPNPTDAAAFSSANGRPPSGPRRPGEGVTPVDAASQGVLAAAPTPSGGARLAVSLLAAGFVIGPAGSSVRDLCALTRADVRSWTEVPARAAAACRAARGGGGGAGTDGGGGEPAELHPAFARLQRPVRVFTVEGAADAVSAALEIIAAAVCRYVRLTDGSFAGRTVARTQVRKRRERGRESKKDEKKEERKSTSATFFFLSQFNPT